MSSKKKNSFFRTLTFRLTLWYGGLFGVLGLVGFLVVYLSLGSNLKKRTDEELLHTATEFEALYDAHGIQALMSEFQRGPIRAALGECSSGCCRLREGRWALRTLAPGAS